MSSADFYTPSDELTVIRFDDPLELFQRWYKQALSADLIEPRAMTLATSTVSGKPSARQVLLKSFDENGFVFFTNYESRKGEELAENPYASLLIWWDKLHRQVRIEGRVSKVSAKESDRYFSTRPKGSQASACVSPQSREIDRNKLFDEYQLMIERVEGESLPRPEFWGGYSVFPEYLEFWQGQPNRLHDRLVYVRRKDGWSKNRLGP